MSDIMNLDEKVKDSNEYVPEDLSRVACSEQDLMQLRDELDSSLRANGSESLPYVKDTVEKLKSYIKNCQNKKHRSQAYNLLGNVYAVLGKAEESCIAYYYAGNDVIGFQEASRSGMPRWMLFFSARHFSAGNILNPDMTQLLLDEMLKTEDYSLCIETMSKVENSTSVPRKTGYCAVLYGILSKYQYIHVNTQLDDLAGLWRIFQESPLMDLAKRNHAMSDMLSKPAPICADVPVPQNNFNAHIYTYFDSCHPVGCVCPEGILCKSDRLKKLKNDAVNFFRQNKDGKKTKDIDSIIAKLRKIIKNPQSNQEKKQAYDLLGSIYCRLDRWQEAVDAYLKGETSIAGFAASMHISQNAPAVFFAARHFLNDKKLNPYIVKYLLDEMQQKEDYSVCAQIPNQIEAENKRQAYCAVLYVILGRYQPDVKNTKINDFTLLLAKFKKNVALKQLIKEKHKIADMLSKGHNSANDFDYYVSTGKKEPKAVASCTQQRASEGHGQEPLQAVDSKSIIVRLLSLEKWVKGLLENELDWMMIYFETNADSVLDKQRIVLEKTDGITLGDIGRYNGYIDKNLQNYGQKSTYFEVMSIADVFKIFCVCWDVFKKYFKFEDYKNWGFKFDACARARNPVAHGLENCVSESEWADVNKYCTQIFNVLEKTCPERRPA